MTRDALLIRELHMHREHAAEAQAFARRRVPQRVHAELDRIAHPVQSWLLRDTGRVRSRNEVREVNLFFSVYTVLIVVDFGSLTPFGHHVWQWIWSVK